MKAGAEPEGSAPRSTVAALLLWIGSAFAIAVLLVGCLLASYLIRPIARGGADVTPRDAGLPYEEVSFASHDGLRLAGWLIGPDLAQPPVIILHGFSDNKTSYLDQARFLYENGFPSLLYDQRGHGQSAPAHVSLGVLESADVVEAIRFLEGRGKGSRFVVWGVSMGAATALLAATRTPGIAGVVAESSYERLDRVVGDTLRLRFGVPAFPLVPLVLTIASWRTGAELNGLCLSAAVEALGRRPLLVVSGERDPRMPPELGARLFAAARGPKEHLVLPEADHAQCWSLGRRAYGEKVRWLLEVSFAATPEGTREDDPARGR